MHKKILEKDSKYQHDQQKIHSQLTPTDQGSATLQRITKELVGLGRSLVITGMSLEMGDKAEDISNFYPNITTETVIERVLIKPKLLSESVPNYYVGDVVPAMHAKHILIVSSWRSGSTFLGDILNHYPGTFYTFEPLIYGDALYMPGQTFDNKTRQLKN